MMSSSQDASIHTVTLKLNRVQKWGGGGGRGGEREENEMKNKTFKKRKSAPLN